jgi:hypothetical protein
MINTYMAKDNTFIRDAVENINRINGNETLLDLLLEFEKILDETGIYAYKNWSLGEVVEGPLLERHWFNVTLMYPHGNMPDPEAMRRLNKQGCKVEYVKDQIEFPRKVKSLEDIEDLRSKTPKTDTKDVWLVKIEMPRRFIENFDDRSLEISGKDIDMSSLNQAYDEGLGDGSAAQQQGQDIQMDATAAMGAPIDAEPPAA